MQVFAAPETRFCPAGVYEYVNEADKDKLVINAQVSQLQFFLFFNFATTINPKYTSYYVYVCLCMSYPQNCIHCKCCSIKMPHEYIQWTVPEGGGGPQYQVM
jgi:electron-transferring-flavoprotein dehydrogenase